VRCFSAMLILDRVTAQTCMLGSYCVVPLNKNCHAEPCGNETNNRMHSAFHVLGKEQTFLPLNRVAAAALNTTLGCSIQEYNVYSPSAERLGNKDWARVKLCLVCLNSRSPVRIALCAARFGTEKGGRMPSPPAFFPGVCQIVALQFGALSSDHPEDGPSFDQVEL
jgi:hypothetical protein